MGFFKDVLGGLIGGAGSVLSMIPGVSPIASAAMGLLGNSIGGAMNNQNSKELIEMQNKQQKEMLALQNEYNKEAAAKSQEYNKEMFDYTSYPHQVELLKEAGLNPALLYGKSGGSGGQASGATQQGVGLPQATGVEMGLRYQEMKNQQRLQEAEIKSAEADAKLKEAEADKKSGCRHRRSNS